MRNAVLDEFQVGVKTGRRNSSNLRYADDTTLMAESEEELKSLLMSVKEESERASLKLNIKRKKKIMASSPITSWQVEGKKVEVVHTSSSWALKSLQMVTIATKSEYFASWQESYDKPRQCVGKQRYYSAYKGLYSQGYGLPSGHLWL